MGAPLGHGSRFAPRHRHGICSTKISVVGVSPGATLLRLGEKHRHLFVSFLSSDRQRRIVPVDLRCGIRSALQEEANNGEVAVVGGQVEWSLLLLVCDVHVRARLQQHLSHVDGAHLHGEVQRRATIVVGFVRIRSVLEEHLDDLMEPLVYGLDQRRVSPSRLRPVDLDTTPVGQPLQQPPRGVRLPAGRGVQQRSLFVPPPPNFASTHRHEALRVKPRVGDVQVPELRQGRQDVHPALQAKTCLDVQLDELLHFPQRLEAALQVHAPAQAELTELAKVLQRVEAARKPHAHAHVEEFKSGAEGSERLKRCASDGFVARQVDVLESRAPTQRLLQKEAPLHR